MKKLILLLSTFLLCTTAFSQEQYIIVDNAKIRVNTIGIENRKTGEPVIVFESGYGTPMGHWGTVLKGVADLAPVVAYDRPGLGKSEAVDYEPTIKNVSDRLVKILKELKVKPPYVLVGHSLGGVYVRGFAVHYPEMLAGLIIVDPADFTEKKSHVKGYYSVLDLSDAKIDSLVNSFLKKRGSVRTEAPIALQREGQVLEDLRQSEFEEITSSKLPNIPVHFLVSGRFDYPKKFWSKEYDELTLYKSKNKQRIARWLDVTGMVDKGMLFYSGDAGHFIHRDDPELLITSVKIVLQDYEALMKEDK